MGTRTLHRGSHERAFFVYDHRKHGEEDDPKDAILYFYPPSVDIQEQIALVGGIIGTLDFCREVLHHTPALISLTTCRFALLKAGPFILGLSSEISAPEQYVTQHLQYLWNTFCLFQGSLMAVKQRTGNDGFTLELDRIWTSYFSLSQSFSDRLSQAFGVIPYRELSLTQSSVFLEASHILQRAQQEMGVIGGVLLNKSRVLCTQLTPDITRRLLLLMPHERNFPCIEVKPDFDLPAGVRLLYAFLTPEELSFLGPRKQANSHRRKPPEHAAENVPAPSVNIVNPNSDILQSHAQGLKFPHSLSAVAECVEIHRGEGGNGEEFQDTDQFYSLDGASLISLTLDENSSVAEEDTLKALAQSESKKVASCADSDGGASADGKNIRGEGSLPENTLSYALNEKARTRTDSSSVDECAGEEQTVIAEIHRNDLCNERTEVSDGDRATECHREKENVDDICDDGEVVNRRRKYCGDASAAEDGGSEIPSVSHNPGNEVTHRQQCDSAGNDVHSSSLSSENLLQPDPPDADETVKGIEHEMGNRESPCSKLVVVNGASNSGDVDAGVSPKDLMTSPTLVNNTAVPETAGAGAGGPQTGSTHDAQVKAEIDHSERERFSAESVQPGTERFIDESVTLLSGFDDINGETEIQKCINRLTDTAQKFLSSTTEEDGNCLYTALSSDSDDTSQKQYSSPEKVVTDILQNDTKGVLISEDMAQMDRSQFPVGDSNANPQLACSPGAQVVHFDSTPKVIGEEESEHHTSVPVDRELNLDLMLSGTSSVLTISDDLMSPSKERLCFENAVQTSESSSGTSASHTQIASQPPVLRECSTEPSSSDMARSLENLSAPLSSSSSTILSSPGTGPAGQGKDVDLGLEGRKEVVLYVQGHMDTLLVLLMENEGYATKETINVLWKSSLAKLAELDFAVSDTYGPSWDDMNNQSSYLYLKYNTASQAMQGTATAPVTSLANELVSSGVLLHDTFSSLPAAQDILCKTHTTCCYGHKTMCSETFFQVMAAKGGGFPDPRDIAFRLDQFADRKLYADHGSALL